MAQLAKNRGIRRRSVMTPELSPPLSDEASTLERIISGIPDGRNTVLSYARQLAFKDDRYRDFIRDFDKDKRQDIGHLCREHNIAPQDFLADVNREAYPIIEEASKVAHGIARDIVTKRLPKVVDRGMIEAAKADGISDRHFTLQKEGFHVAPKGTVISLTQNQLNQQAAGLDDFSDEVKDMASILGESEPLQLEEGERDYINAEIEVEEKVEVPV